MPSLTKSTDNLERAPIDEPIRCGYDWCIDQVAPMTDPKNSEAMNEELGLEQLEDAAGGFEPGLYYDDVSLVPFKSEPKRNKQNVGGTSGPGGTTFLKQNVGGTSGPGGTSF